MLAPHDKNTENAALAQNQLSHKTMGIRGRLLLGFAAVAAILILAVGGILLVVNSSQNFAKKVISIELPLHDELLDLALQVTQSASIMESWYTSNDITYKNNLDRVWSNIANLQLKIDELIKSKNQSDSEFSKQWQQITVILSKLHNIEFTSLSAPKNTKTPLDIKKIDDLHAAFLTILDGPINEATGERTGGMFDTQYQNLTSGTTRILNDLSMIKLIVWLLMLSIIIVSVIIAVVTANKIVTPLFEAITIARNIATGNKNNKIKIKRHDETGILLTALAKMQNAIKENEKKLEQTEEHTRNLFNNIVETAKVYSSHSGKVAAGDLRQRLTIGSDDIMAQLGNDLNGMTESLANITKQITDTNHNMISTLDEVRQAVNVQTSGASEQASSINQITASLEEIEKSSAQTMEKAKDLGAIAERTREKGQQGLEAVEESILGMKTVRDKVQIIAQTILDLSNQTQQVSKITAAVNNLAQQSKMLALNASIEASKAGEAGKGFAVVAVEVKNLAEQSEQSTSQVQKILEEIKNATEKAVMVTEEGTKGVDQGTKLVEQTGEVVRSLSDVISEATIASRQIEAAVKQEGVGIEQITVGMSEINQVTASFVASSNQTLNAINHLSETTKKLKEHVDTYKI